METGHGIQGLIKVVTAMERSKITATLAVGLPVYNGEQYVAQAIESVLAQTFSDLILVIGDNASIDRTGEICRGYADADPRVRYIRNDENIGIDANAAQVFYRSQPTEFFCLIGHDDYIEPAFAERLVDLLRAQPEACLAMSNYRCKFEYDTPDTIAMFHKEMEEMHSFSTGNRLWRICHQSTMMFVHGVVRSRYFDPSLFVEYHGIYQDVFFLRALAGMGPFLTHQEVLFTKRYHKKSCSNMPDYTRENKKKDLLRAALVMKRVLSLNSIETFLFWASLAWLFRMKKPLIRNVRRARRILKIGLSILKKRNQGDWKVHP